MLSVHRESGEPARLLRLALEHPDQADAQATELLAVADDAWWASVAHHVRGLAWREQGALDSAVSELRTAVRRARTSRDPDRTADVRATLGATLVMAGRTSSGLDALDRAVAAAQGAQVRATVLMRRGYVLSLILGRHREGQADVVAALETIGQGTDTVWEARTLNTLAGVYMAQGHARRAEGAIRRAEQLFTAAGQDLEAAYAVANRGRIALIQGDLPTALARYDEAETRGRQLGDDSELLAIDYARALLTAGLSAEATDVVRRQLLRSDVRPTRRAELLLSLSTVQQANRQWSAALSSAREARSLFRRQERHSWVRLANLAALRARYGRGDRTPALAAAAGELASALEDSDWRDAATAWLVAGRMAADLQLDTAEQLLRTAARYRHDGSAIVRGMGWMARAVACDAQTDRRGVLRACSRGLDALDDHRATLGSAELRALASIHGEELAGMALRHAAQVGSRVLLAWSERWRATALRTPSVRPTDDDELSGMLVALRDAHGRRSQAEVDGTSEAGLDRTIARLEDAVRRHRRRVAGAERRSGQGGLAEARADVERLVDQCRGRTFLQLVRVDEQLIAVVVADGRVRQLPLGTHGGAQQAIEFARFALRQVGRGRAVDLSHAGQRLQDELLGPVLRMLGDGPVVISPTPTLHVVPWGLMPALAVRAVSVVPSAALWLRARDRQAASDDHVLIVGPGLESDGAEVAVLAQQHPEARVLRDGTATVERCLQALDGAALAHVAAHGRFRPDSPMFSELELDDGPLTVHDFERLRRAPHRFVLSACESGVLAPLGSTELLGLASVLLSLGTAGVLSSLVQVDDAATVATMVEVHSGLDAGDDLGEALCRARLAARGDRVAEATAASFVPLGV